MLLTTPTTIRTLQRKLYAKAKQEPAYRFYNELALSARFGVKNIGKPCAGKLHARFDEGGQPKGCPLLYQPRGTPPFVHLPRFVFLTGAVDRNDMM